MTRRRTGEIRRYSRKVSVWKKRATPPHPWRFFIASSRTKGSRGKPREFFWYYKAGFNAARLLEEQQKWDSAAVIYQKLAAAEAHGATKPRRVSLSCAWNISFGNNDRFSLILVAKIKLHKTEARRKIAI